MINSMHFFKKRNKGTIMFMVIGALSICTIVAFGMISTVTNEFKAQGINMKMYEEFSPPPDWDGESVDKKVFFESKGTAPTVLRVKYSEEWKREDGLSLSNTVESKNVMSKKWTKDGLGGDAWTLIDGWYYYEKQMNKGDKVQILESVALDTAVVGDVKKPIVEDYFKATYELSFVYEYQSLSSAMEKGAWDALASVANETTKEISWKE